MRFELKRVEPLRAANIGALVYGIMMAAFAVLFAPFLLLGMWLAPTGGQNTIGLTATAIMFCCYPLMGLVLGWLSGLVSSAAFNLVVGLTGGLVLHFDGRAVDQHPAAPIDRIDP
jgi:hypothetical protein